MNDLHSITLRLIKNEPVLESLNLPAAKPTGCRPTEAAPHAHPWYEGQCFKAAHELIQKTLSGFQTGLFFQVIKLSIDFAPREGAH
jgi:hypothetical protein